MRRPNFESILEDTFVVTDIVSPIIDISPELNPDALPVITINSGLNLDEPPIFTIDTRSNPDPFPIITIDPGLNLDEPPLITIDPGLNLDEPPLITIDPGLNLDPFPIITSDPELNLDAPPIITISPGLNLDAPPVIEIEGFDPDDFPIIDIEGFDQNDFPIVTFNPVSNPDDLTIIDSSPVLNRDDLTIINIDPGLNLDNLPTITIDPRLNPNDLTIINIGSGLNPNDLPTITIEPGLNPNDLPIIDIDGFDPDALPFIDVIPGLNPDDFSIIRIIIDIAARIVTGSTAGGVTTPSGPNYRVVVEGNGSSQSDDGSSLLNTPFFLFENSNQPEAFIYTHGIEADIIKNNDLGFDFLGFQFYAAIEPNDELITFYRFRNKELGSHLFVGQEERNSIIRNSDLTKIFEEEGPAFYAYASDANRETDFIRFRNENVIGSYLFIPDFNAENFSNNNPNFVSEGPAFEARI